MDGVRLQAKIYKGYGKATKHIGLPFARYRSATWMTPIASGNLVDTILASFVTTRAENFNYGKAEGPADYLRNALVDCRTMQIGDVLVHASGTYYIAALPPLLPPSAVKADATVSVLRPISNAAAASPSVGLIGYGGVLPDIAAIGQDGESLLATGVPAAIGPTRSGTRPGGLLPADAAGPNAYVVYLPLPKGWLRDRDIIIDELGHRYQVSVADWTYVGCVAQATRLET